MVMQPAATFDEIRSDPEWREFTQNEQGRIRRDWVTQMMGRVSVGTPEKKEEWRQQLIENAYSDAPDWQRPVQVKSLYPQSIKEGLKMGWGGITRAWSMPQQYIQSVLAGTEEVGGMSPPERRRRMAIEPFIHAGKYFMGGPEDVEKYPYTMRTDPLMITAAPGLAVGGVKMLAKIASKLPKQLPTLGKIVRGAEALKGRIRPPSGIKAAGETAEAFNARMVGEEAAKREALKGRISAIKSGEETVRRVEGLVPGISYTDEAVTAAGIDLQQGLKQGIIKPTGTGHFEVLKPVGGAKPILRGPYNRAMPKLTPHFPKQEAQKVAEFVARHPDDLISKEVLTGKPLSESVVSEINRRIFNRVPQPPVTPPPAAGFRIKPPVAEPPVGTVGGVNLNDPMKLAEELLRRGQ